MQGLQTLTAEGLKVILRCVSSLAMKDSIFLGELPYSALGDISQVFQAFFYESYGKLLVEVEENVACGWKLHLVWVNY